MDSRHDAILDSITEGVFTVDLDWKVTSFNRAAEQITGIAREEAIGRFCFEVFRASICEAGCQLRRTLEDGAPNIDRSAYILRHDGRRIPITISTAVLRDDRDEVVGGVETFRDLSTVERLRKELKQRYTFHDIVSKNDRVHALLHILPQVAAAEATVLIEGESGTGKELFARAIHALSPRRDSPMVTVNSAALPEALLESELFGHKAGAFTDARHDRPGRFALAEGGTLFLDEIGDVPIGTQVRLLRVLQEKRYEPLGGTETLHADVRIIAATNRPLQMLVEQGSFREDLYYRLNVINLCVPPLRDRREDIPLLAEHFVEHFNQLQDREISGVSTEVLELFMRHPFPGNIRELRNAVEHAFVVCRGGSIRIAHLPAHLRPEGEDATHSQPSSLQEIEAQMVRAALKRNGFRRDATALELGIHKTTLWRKMKRLGIDDPR